MTPSARLVLAVSCVFMIGALIGFYGVTWSWQAREWSRRVLTANEMLAPPDRFWTVLTLKLLLAIAILDVRRLRLPLRSYWRRWAALPGDRWVNWQQDLCGEVLEIKGDVLILSVWTRQAETALGLEQAPRQRVRVHFDCGDRFEFGTWDDQPSWGWTPE